jgi:glycosyltransferase involved in cell wall biosynthesis
MSTNTKRIAAFGFRSIPSTAGCAGADKFAEELFTRLVECGYEVHAYNRTYEGTPPTPHTYKGINIISFRTVQRKGFDTLLHSLKATWHIIRHNTGNIVHIQNGGNSIWALPLRLAGKKVFISQDGVDWKRDKWPWYGKLYLYLSSFMTAYLPNKVIFDNIFVKEVFENKFKKEFNFIPFGSEVTTDMEKSNILKKLKLISGEYFLFVGRFIPDKGLQYLIPAFEQVETDKKLVLVGGSPNPSEFEKKIKSTKDKRVIFPGFIYGADANALMKNAYAYIQPSDVEGLSPVILENMGLNTPIICSDIKENLYVVDDTALTFRQGDINDARHAIEAALADPGQLKENAKRAHKRASENFSWNAVTTQHIELFTS